MALNPVLATESGNKPDLFPMPQPGEVFVLKREGISFTATNHTKTYSGKGRMFLTSQRIVFLRSGKPEQHKVFTSVELPLRLMYGKLSSEPPEFKQPVFGANYLEGNIDPLETAPHPLVATSRWTLSFMKGGCQTFLQAFYRLHKRAREHPNQPGLDPQLQQQLNMGNQAAFYDPSDPSILYLTQPVPANSGYSQQMHQQQQPPLSPQQHAPFAAYPQQQYQQPSPYPYEAQNQQPYPYQQQPYQQQPYGQQPYQQQPYQQQPYQQQPYPQQPYQQQPYQQQPYQQQPYAQQPYTHQQPYPYPQQQQQQCQQPYPYVQQPQCQQPYPNSPQQQQPYPYSPEEQYGRMGPHQGQQPGVESVTVPTRSETSQQDSSVSHEQVPEPAGTPVAQEPAKNGSVSRPHPPQQEPILQEPLQHYPAIRY